MALVYFVTHPDVVIDPLVPVPDWRLSDVGAMRMRTFATNAWLWNVGDIFSSNERKATDSAQILSSILHKPHSVVTDLGENDRSSTGYLPKIEFEATAREFFAQPNDSVRGWERAVDAQRRIVSAVDRVLAAAQRHSDVAIISHGGVGALCLCALKGVEISETASQPGGAGGNFFVFDRATKQLLLDWRSIG